MEEITVLIFIPYLIVGVPTFYYGFNLEDNFFYN